jgi:hypothetical protein
LAAVTSIATDPLLVRHLLVADMDTTHPLFPTHGRNVVVFRPEFADKKIPQLASVAGRKSALVLP